MILGEWLEACKGVGKKPLGLIGTSRSPVDNTIEIGKINLKRFDRAASQPGVGPFLLAGDRNHNS